MKFAAERYQLDDEERKYLKWLSSGGPEKGKNKDKKIKKRTLRASPSVLFLINSLSDVFFITNRKDQLTTLLQ